MISRRKMLASAACTTPLGLCAQTTSPWPNRPIKLLVGFPSGQASDILARFYADLLQKELGQPVVVENRPGAGATIAVGLAAAAPADGHTLLFTSSGPMAVAPHLYAKLGFDPLKDVEPVAVVGVSALILIVRPDHPARTVPQLLSVARTKELQGGSGGNGVTNHLALELFKIATGAKITHVPYKGAGPAMADLMGGHIDMMFESSGAALVQVKAGRLRALAVTSPTRYPELPEVPAISELYPGFDAMTWAMVAAPRGTPPSILDRLSTLFNRVMTHEVAKKQLRGLGVEVTPGTSPSTAKAYLNSEYQKWGEVIRKANIKIE